MFTLTTLARFFWGEDLKRGEMLYAYEIDSFRSGLHFLDYLDHFRFVKGGRQ